MPDRVNVPGPTLAKVGPFFLANNPKLSPRQREVLRLAALGYSDQEIAGVLFLSVWTVRDYLRTARAALGARNTTHAVAVALGNNLI